MANDPFDQFVAAFGAARVRCDAPLAPFTTFKVGGPAQCLVEVHDSRELASAWHLAAQTGVPSTILGGGSNVLVSDAGVRGVVIRTHGGVIALEGEAGVRADAGVSLNSLVRWTIGRGLAGLETWAGTPGSVGGAVFGNAHYGGRSVGELIASVRLIGAGHDIVDVPAREMEFAYDRSRLQRTGDVVLSVLFALSASADPALLRETARRSLADRKRTQPLDTPSAGCIFQNPDPAVDSVPDGIPASAGALIDRAGLKGHAIGGARVSAAHANFILNEGGATASDIRRLIDLCRDEVRARFGVTLREEIRYLGG
ncbi:MAG TPA: UDP-N-acetylmuramate dehydrogenase [Vicinamibacterales bacterium]